MSAKNFVLEKKKIHLYKFTTYLRIKILYTFIKDRVVFYTINN